jgi:hypothetical protein
MGDIWEITRTFSYGTSTGLRQIFTSPKDIWADDSKYRKTSSEITLNFCNFCYYTFLDSI